ncbi:MAG: hypothetical protein OXE94_04030 [Aestuariivita sp.]|nr:hypothetical protein [Aestuariivita sp.]MCY4201688.1 hypothetical protein [Aestuariivita sp.]
MIEKKRLYPTVSEEQKKSDLKSELGLTNTAISKGGGMPMQKSLEKPRDSEWQTVSDLQDAC